MGYGRYGLAFPQTDEANSPEKILETLKSELPICFKSDKEIVPLEIGITNDVIYHYTNDKRFTENELTRAVFYYLNSKDYLKSMKAGVVKIDLQGKARRTVTKDEEDDAQNALKKILDKHNEKIKINLSMPLKGGRR
jgi:ProP effector